MNFTESTGLQTLDIRSRRSRPDYSLGAFESGASSGRRNPVSREQKSLHNNPDTAVLQSFVMTSEALEWNPTPILHIVVFKIGIGSHLGASGIMRSDK